MIEELKSLTSSRDEYMAFMYWLNGKLDLGVEPGAIRCAVRAAANDGPESISDLMEVLELICFDDVKVRRA